MRVYDRDLIRGGHYGQRSCEPHLQAEHMAAPTNAAKREESSCQLGAVHTWHETDVTARADDVSSSGESRHCGCEYLRSDFDPRVRPLQPWGGGWSNLWSLSAQDRWAWFIGKKFAFFRRKTPLLRLELFSFWDPKRLPANRRNWELADAQVLPTC